jgi:hypothetical protein
VQEQSKALNFKGANISAGIDAVPGFLPASTQNAKKKDIFHKITVACILTDCF